jgi:sec-independent protein translocase protein TatC
VQKYTFKEHLVEIKKRFLIVLVFYIAAFAGCYLFREDIYSFFLRPLVDILGTEGRKIIYTGLAEAFFSYIKLSIFSAFCLTIPVMCYQLYAFVAPGLLKFEKRIVMLLMSFAPILFYIGSLFVFYFVMPRAWEFFLSYENNSAGIPLVLEARISEYLELVIQFTLAFGFAFQLPVVMVILGVMGLVHSDALRKKRRIAIVIIFILAAIFTPPDVISQIALAIPLLLLYEISIILCKLVENRGSKKC